MTSTQAENLIKQVQLYQQELQNLLSQKGAFTMGDCFNVGSDRVYSLKRIIKIFSSIKKINCSIEFIKDKVDFYIPDISKSKLFFNLKHNGNLKDNLLSIKN